MGEPRWSKPATGRVYNHVATFGDVDVWRVVHFADTYGPRVHTHYAIKWTCQRLAHWHTGMRLPPLNFVKARVPKHVKDAVTALLRFEKEMSHD